jgi:hypothetical protein
MKKIISLLNENFTEDESAGIRGGNVRRLLSEELPD